MSGRTTRQLASGMASGSMSNRVGEFGAEIVDNVGKFIDNVDDAVKGPLNKIQDMLKSGDNEGAQQTYAQFQRDIKDKEKELKNAPAAMQMAAMNQLSEQSNQMAAGYSALSAIGGKTELPKTLDMSMDFSELGIQGSNVNRAAARTAAAASSARGTNAAIPTTSEGNQELTFAPLTINLEHTCPSCGDKTKDSSQSYQVNTAQKVRK
jgi:hypothetical protein